MARSAGLDPLYAHMAKAVPSSNLSNSSNVSCSCELLKLEGWQDPPGPRPGPGGVAGKQGVHVTSLFLDPETWLVGTEGGREGGREGYLSTSSPSSLSHFPCTNHSVTGECQDEVSRPFTCRLN